MSVNPYKYPVGIEADGQIIHVISKPHISTSFLIRSDVFTPWYDSILFALLNTVSSTEDRLQWFVLIGPKPHRPVFQSGMNRSIQNSHCRTDWTNAVTYVWRLYPDALRCICCLLLRLPYGPDGVHKVKVQGRKEYYSTLKKKELCRTLQKGSVDSQKSWNVSKISKNG